MIVRYKNLIDQRKLQKNIRIYKRYSVILKHFQGLTNRKIVEMENLEEHTVSVYIKNYNTKCIDGLAMKHSPGAKRKLNSEQEKMIVDVVTNKTPDKV